MTFQEFMVKVGETFTHNIAITVITIAILFALFYFTIRILYGNNAKWVIVVFAVYLVGTGTIFIIADISGWNYFQIPLLFVVGVVAMFATEIKREIWKVRSKKTSDAKNSVRNYSNTVNRKVIDEMIKALLNMSKNNVGAIIVLADENLQSSIVESGTVLDAEISAPLIESIFYPKTALHDGAMIISGMKIHAAGCFLPLPQSQDIPKELGSRHRAGIGITENTAVTAIIVSEENGIISIANNKKISRYADSEMLRNKLCEYFWQETTDKHKSKGKFDKGESQ